MRQTSQAITAEAVGIVEARSAGGETAHSRVPAPGTVRGATKLRIQEAALDLFVQQGYEKTSLREIADRLGITKAALYYHYASKQDLLKSLTQPLIDEFEHVLAERLPRRDLLAAYLDLLARNQRVFEIFASDHSSLAAAELAERSLRTRRELVRQLAGDGAAPADLVRAAAALGAVTQGFVVATGLEAGLDPSADFQANVAVADAAFPEGEELAALLISTALRVMDTGPTDRGPTA